MGECELVSRESPLSVALGVLPSVILSARPYFVAHAHAPSLAYTRASVHARARARATHRASAFRQSCTTRDPGHANEPRFLASQSVTHGRRQYRDLRVYFCPRIVDLFYNEIEIPILMPVFSSPGQQSACCGFLSAILSKALKLLFLILFCKTLNFFQQ